jgi:transketolase
MDKQLEIKVKEFAKKVRLTQMEMFKTLGFGHIGGALSATDIIGLLYEGVMNYKPEDPSWEGRDRLVCSKGHAGPAIYSTLALKGFFPMEWIHTLNKGGTNLPSHCDKNKTPGIDMTTGSLGQGGSAALGMAIGLKGTGQKVFLIMGDGECNEGQVWEMALSAAHHKANNLIAFVDYNHKQLDGTTDDVLDLGDIADKFRAFGWYTQTVDGHDVAALYDAIEDAKANAGDRPSMIVMNTVKGKGVKFIEDTEFNHHIMISKEDADRAIEEIQSEVIG